MLDKGFLSIRVLLYLSDKQLFTCNSSTSSQFTRFSRAWAPIINLKFARTRTFEWHRRFMNGREDCEDDPRWTCRRPSTSRSLENKEQLRRLVRADRRLTVQMTADGQCSVWESLEMRNVCAKMVPKLWSTEQKKRKKSRSFWRHHRIVTGRAELSEECDQLRRHALDISMWSWNKNDRSSSGKTWIATANKGEDVEVKREGYYLRWTQPWRGDKFHQASRT